MKRFITSLCLGALTVLSCQENLPPYVDPNALGVEPDVKYVFTNSDNSLWVEFVVTNHFDETLQAKPVIQGTGRITWKKDPTRYRSFTLTELDVTSGYNPATGVLTIDPGKTIRLRYTWNFVDDSASDLTARFVYYADPTCNGPTFYRRIAYRETFVVTGSLRVFEKIPAIVVVPAEFSMCYVTNFVLPNYCIPIDPDKSCRP